MGGDAAVTVIVELFEIKLFRAGGITSTVE